MACPSSTVASAAAWAPADGGVHGHHEPVGVDQEKASERAFDWSTFLPEDHIVAGGHAMLCFRQAEGGSERWTHLEHQPTVQSTRLQVIATGVLNVLLKA
jgi:hypothetical protein